MHRTCMAEKVQQKDVFEKLKGVEKDPGQTRQNRQYLSKPFGKIRGRSVGEEKKKNVGWIRRGQKKPPNPARKGLGN